MTVIFVNVLRPWFNDIYNIRLYGWIINALYCTYIKYKPRYTRDNERVGICFIIIIIIFWCWSDEKTHWNTHRKIEPRSNNYFTHVTPDKSKQLGHTLFSRQLKLFSYFVDILVFSEFGRFFVLSPRIREKSHYSHFSWL